MPAPIDPTAISAIGPEWQVPGIGPAKPTAVDGGGGSGEGFGGMLAHQIQNLQQTQTDAASASQSLANGTATDVSSTVMAVEKARLSMQLASQFRTKAVEAYQDLFHTPV